MKRPANRTEHDLLGDRAIPGNAYYGVHTLRALENFPISGLPISIYPDLVTALACVKQAAALANNDLKLLDDGVTHAIVEACEEIRGGALLEEFVVDVIQGGAGTSTNMNANEVIANRALEIMGRKKGEYQHLHPLDHVNMSQSTNDVYPTAVKLAVHEGIVRLTEAMAELRAAFAAKAKEFDGVMKMGRTQLQDAVPMTLGQEFSTYGVMLEEDELRLLSSGPRAGFNEINLPAVQAGSSIMPGKVNPVIPEVVNQVAFEVIGNDVTVSFAAEGGQLQLNAFEPVIAHSLFKSLKHLKNACDTLRTRCVTGITANRDYLLQTVEQSISIVTALNPHIGYERASEVAREAYAANKTVREVVLGKKLLTGAQLDEILQPELLTRPGYVPAMRVQTEPLAESPAEAAPARRKPKGAD